MTNDYVTKNDFKEFGDMLISQISEMFEIQNDRFDRIDGRLDGIDGRLDGIDSRLDGIDGRLDKLEDGQRAIRRDISENTQRLERVENELTALTNDIGDLYGADSTVMKEHVELKKQVRSLQNWARTVSKNTGIPLPK